MKTCHCDNMDEFSKYSAKLNKSDKDKTPYDFPYMWNLKKNNNNKMEIDTNNKQMVARGERGEMGKGDYTKFQLQNK